MKNRYIRIFMVFCTAFILILGNGCFLKSHKTLMLEYLEDKYGEEFEPLSYAGESWAYSYDKLSAHPKGKEDQIFNIQGCKNKEGKYVCHDNYFYYIIRDEYEQAMSNIVKIYFTDFKLYMQRGDFMYGDNLNYGTKVEDIYSNDERFCADINMFVKKSEIMNQNIDGILKKIAQERVKKKLVGGLFISIIIDDNRYKLIDRKNWNKIMNIDTEPFYDISVYPNLKVDQYRIYPY
ncbi:MAG: hypothetical protein PHG06_10160 [Parabacteroides sp.]|nr:hypothetical protein [Parabacteroides sp.]